MKKLNLTVQKPTNLTRPFAGQALTAAISGFIPWLSTAFGDKVECSANTQRMFNGRTPNTTLYGVHFRIYSLKIMRLPSELNAG